MSPHLSGTAQPAGRIGATVDDLDTPCLVVDLDKVDHNIAFMASVAERANVSLRPHVKTHKTPHLAKQQLAAGATGITVAKVSEAEIFSDAGCDDILIAYTIVGEAKANRLVDLARRSHIRVCVDGFVAAQNLSAAAQARHQDVDVLLDVDTGLGRTGCPPDEALDLGLRVAALPNLNLIGVFSYAGYPSHDPSAEKRREWALRDAGTAARVAQGLRDVGLETVQVVSVAGTACASFAAEVSGVTEIRPGTYIFGDANCIRIGSMREADCALSIRTRVVGRSAPDHAVLDAGSKTLSFDPSVDKTAPGFGLLVDHEQSRISRIWEEHAVVTLAPDDQGLRVGEIVSVIPNHVCPVVNLADVWYGIRDGRVTEVHSVSARGLVQ